ncbi:RNA-binding domain-containing protein [Basidiobolus meristosporus CBS 931.73]|uniref:RNA-binding domain-containing protein n=1 Tax=Basidiobolus meristosporus CBS 931.73 TaxID=1314790 RepID=A0A1Y1X4F9_9FUNG|nr:RNA-binding domain-containing protein [Basidiobolus meristosporus CBS 931.73]|eukprot:ORX80535.1 RNA-binding domain-containing protein [Basidiobolus meristosporus CBS 931.73]
MSSRVYIGRLARDVRERDVEKLLKGYGDIREITLKNGFGFVEFRDQKDAEDVVYDFNGKEFFNERIIVELARGERKRNERTERNPRDRRETSRYGPPQRTQHRVIVENLASSASWQDLKDFMRKAGEVTFADAHREKEGTGVVEFSSYDDMKSAIKKLDDSELKGKKVVLKEDPGRSRRRSHSRSRSPRRNSRRSRSRSRSRSPRDRGDRRRNARPRSRSPRDRSDRRRSPRSRSRSPRDREERRKPSHSRSPSPARDRREDTGSPKGQRSRSGSRSPIQENGRLVENGE